MWRPLLLLLCTTLVRAGELQLEIGHSWMGEPLQIPSPLLTTREGDRIRITRLDYLLSEPSVQGAQLRKRTDWFAFAGVRDAPVRLRLAGLPEGEIRSLGLHIGPDAQTDAADPSRYAAKHPLNMSG